MGNSRPMEPSEAENSQIDITSTASDATQVARLLLLIKENQLATAVVLFFAWQAGLFIEAWMAIQGMCSV